jgi:hypothetical protein
VQNSVNPSSAAIAGFAGPDFLEKKGGGKWKTLLRFLFDRRNGTDAGVGASDRNLCFKSNSCIIR